MVYSSLSRRQSILLLAELLLLSDLGVVRGGSKRRVRRRSPHSLFRMGLDLSFICSLSAKDANLFEEANPEDEQARNYVREKILSRPETLKGQRNKPADEHKRSTLRCQCRSASEEKSFNAVAFPKHSHTGLPTAPSTSSGAKQDLCVCVGLCPSGGETVRFVCSTVSGQLRRIG